MKEGCVELQWQEIQTTILQFHNIQTPTEFKMWRQFTHRAKSFWPSPGPHSALALSNHTSKNGGPLVAQVWFARGGPYVGYYLKQTTVPVVTCHYKNSTLTASHIVDKTLAVPAWHQFCPTPACYVGSMCFCVRVNNLRKVPFEWLCMITFSMTRQRNTQVLQIN